MGDTEVGDAWCDEVCWKLNKDGDAVSTLLVQNELLDLGEGRECFEMLFSR